MNWTSSVICNLCLGWRTLSSLKLRSREMPWWGNSFSKGISQTCVISLTATFPFPVAVGCHSLVGLRKNLRPNEGVPSKILVVEQDRTLEFDRMWESAVGENVQSFGMSLREDGFEFLWYNNPMDLDLYLCSVLLYLISVRCLVNEVHSLAAPIREVANNKPRAYATEITFIVASAIRLQYKLASDAAYHWRRDALVVTHASCIAELVTDQGCVSSPSERRIVKPKNLPLALFYS